MQTSVSKLPNGVRCKPLAIGRRRETKFTSKQSVKGIGGSEPASLRNTIERPGRRFQKPAGMVEAQVQHMLSRCPPDIAYEATRKASLAHSCARGECRHTQIGTRSEEHTSELQSLMRT